MAELARIDLKPIIEDIVGGNVENSDQLDSRDAENRKRVNHTGTQSIDTIDDSDTYVKMTPDERDLISTALQSETTTSLALNTNSLDYTDETGTVTSVDLSAYLDEDSRSITSGTLDASTGTVTFTRDDDSTFTLDLSGLLDDTNLVTSVAGKTGEIALDAADIGETDSLKVMTADERDKLNGVEDGATADQDASEVSVTPQGNLSSDTVQLALEELQDDIDTLNEGDW